MSDLDIKQVLVVDDEVSVRDFVERALNYAGFAVTSAENGQVALEKLQENTFDLMLTMCDWMMSLNLKKSWILEMMRILVVILVFELAFLSLALMLIQM